MKSPGQIAFEAYTDKAGCHGRGLPKATWPPQFGYPPKPYKELVDAWEAAGSAVLLAFVEFASRMPPPHKDK